MAKKKVKPKKRTIKPIKKVSAKRTKPRGIKPKKKGNIRASAKKTRSTKQKKTQRRYSKKLRILVPRKGTKKYKRWLKRYRHLRKCSKARALAFRLYPELFPTYASTAAFCKYFLKQKKRLTLANFDEAIKQFTQTIAKPDIPEYYLANWFWFEMDFRVDELRDYVVTNLIPNLWVRSQLSSIPAFLINEYTYDSTFKAYVDYKNAQQDAGRDTGRDYTELWVSLQFNPRKMRWEFFIEEEDNPGGEQYTPKTPYDTLIKEEGAEEKGPIVARGGEEKTPVAKGKKKTKATGTRHNQLPPKATKPSPKNLKQEIENLQQKRTAIYESIDLMVKEMIQYKNLGEQDLYAQTRDRLKELRKEIDNINRTIVNLKTKQEGGKI